MMSAPVRGLHWFRQDLRLHDQPAITWLLARCDEWLPIFVIDPRLLDASTETQPRARFLFANLAALASDLEERGVPLIVRRGLPESVLPELLRETGAQKLSFEASHGGLAARRDATIQTAAESMGVEVARFEAHTVFAPGEITTAAGRQHQVFTPFRNAWWRAYRDAPRGATRAPRLKPPIPRVRGEDWPRDVGPTSGPELPPAGEHAARRRLARFLETRVHDYAEARDFPAVDGTSRLSAYLRLGVLSVRTCFDHALARAEQEPAARQGVEKWLDELVWREFYAALRAERPEIARENLRDEYDTLEWNDDPEGFKAWQTGRTGFPIVDAGMRQLAESGWMHNRVRMIVASFLTKDLLIDWRRGEAHFRRCLVDYDPASNAGGWQWAASTGTDAQPYFRIFNPWSQGERWDPTGSYIRRWVPELRGLDDAFVHRPHAAPGGAAPYPAPIVDHAERRQLALARYRSARQRAEALRAQAPPRAARSS
jgi:deoxyribodipyrimidine photo-lyase